MKVPVKQKMRFRRGNLDAARQAVEAGDYLAALVRLSKHGKNRQKTARSANLAA